MTSISRIKLVEPKLDAELRQSPNVLALGHATDKKTVTVNFEGEGKRPVRVGYIQQSPIWWMTYRLVLSDKKPPFLQGWALVENTTEEDWQDVALTLVSGRPISFVMDLYQPLYVNRPVVENELFSSLRPQVYNQDFAGRDKDFQAAGVPVQRTKQWMALNGQGRGAMSEVLGAVAPTAPAPAAGPLPKPTPGFRIKSTCSAASSRRLRAGMSASCFSTRSNPPSRCLARNRPCCRSSTAGAGREAVDL